MNSSGNHWLKTPVAYHVWKTRYARKQNDGIIDRSIEDSWQRVARSVAAVETADNAQWQERFYRLLEDFKFLPGGRILAGAGTGDEVTLFNCFVMGPLHDDRESIATALQQAQLTMQAGGGIGYDFSSLAPQGVVLDADGAVAQGPVSVLHRWDSMCSKVLAGGARRGAVMATLRCDHPDIEAFVNAKRKAGVLPHLNISVQVSDAFMHAIDDDGDWPLLFPPGGEDDAADDNCLSRQWRGYDKPVACRIFRSIPARELWRKIMRAAYNSSEPGVLFVDRINQYNNLAYRERVTATNPCGEIPLPWFGACNLGSINLTPFVREPYTSRARFDMQGIATAAHTATRLLDNVIDYSSFPLPQQKNQARSSRRIGLGMTGLGDALIMLGLCYAEESARRQAAAVMRTICYEAYRSSVELAREKGSFPFLDKQAYLRGRFIRSLPQDIRDAISAQGIRNSHLTAIAPAGTISLLANNISSGIEPVFSSRQTRRIRNLSGDYDSVDVDDYAFSCWRQLKGDKAKLPPQFITALQLEPGLHLLMQAALQPFVDNAISKTINIPRDYVFSDFYRLYRQAWKLGLKGCTVFRVTSAREGVLSAAGGCKSSSTE
jgi:ribonucleoside-diphosphate reductase alpha chain